MEVEKYVDQLDGITDIDGFLAGVDDSLSRGIHDYASFDFYRRERGLTGTSEIANKVREYFKICRTAWEKK